MKTYKAWKKGSLGEYLQVGDIVDEGIVNHFLNVLPPAWNSRTLIQLGEPCTYIDGKAIYHTIQRGNAGWIYAGKYFKGQGPR